MFTPPGECPVCGEEVDAGAHACPQCGADDRSGWREVDFDEGAAFDREAFLAEEFGIGRKRPGLAWYWWLAAVVTLLSFLWMAVMR